MFVDVAALHSGADGSHHAGEHARAGADHLSAVPPVAGMFGDFADADAFHEALSAAHARHVHALRAHYQQLDDVGAWAHRAGHAFTALDERNTSELRDL